MAQRMGLIGLIKNVGLYQINEVMKPEKNPKH